MSAMCDACVPRVAGERSNVKGGWIYKGRGVQWQPPIPFTQQPSSSPTPLLSSVTNNMLASCNTVSTTITSSSWVSQDLNTISNNPLRQGEIHTDLVEFQQTFNRSKFHRACSSCSCPYPEAQDVFIHLGGVSLGEERFDNLFLANTITVTKHAGCYSLKHAYDQDDIHPDKTNHLGPLL